MLFKISTLVKNLHNNDKKMNFLKNRVVKETEFPISK